MSAADQNTVNQALIALGQLKYRGTGSPGLRRATVHAFYDGFPSENMQDNATHIEFARQVHNRARIEDRLKLFPSNSAFLNLASDDTMTPVLTAALKAFTDGIGGSNSKTQDYLEIKARYEALVVKRENETAWTEQLTASEIRFMDKFERLQHDNAARETHKPNENAVTYVFLLGRVLETFIDAGVCGDSNGDPVEEMDKVMDDVLTFVEMHGDKTTASFAKVVNKHTAIPGPASGSNLRPGFLALMNSSFWSTSSSDNHGSAKYTANDKITLKRLYRMVHIFLKESQTPWGLLDNIDNNDFVSNIVQLYEAEVEAGVPDMKSLAIVWYLCINRKFMSCVMVDHHELSAVAVLRRLLSETHNLGALDAADHAFDFGHNVNQQM